MKQNDKRSAGIHVGSASIIMIFAVLCLTVFALLSLSTVQAEKRMADAAAEADAGDGLYHQLRSVAEYVSDATSL